MQRSTKQQFVEEEPDVRPVPSAALQATFLFPKPCRVALFGAGNNVYFLLRSASVSWNFKQCRLTARKRQATPVGSRVRPGSRVVINNTRIAPAAPRRGEQSVEESTRTRAASLDGINGISKAGPQAACADRAAPVHPTAATSVKTAFFSPLDTCSTQHIYVCSRGEFTDAPWPRSASFFALKGEGRSVIAVVRELFSEASLHASQFLWSAIFLGAQRARICIRQRDSRPTRPRN